MLKDNDHDFHHEVKFCNVRVTVAKYKHNIS